MWGGGYESLPSEIMQEINQSITFDKELYQYDIAGSKAHAKMLCQQGIITKQELREITQGLMQIESEITDGTFNFKIELEDIHMNIEARLQEIIGEPASKLHTARSRNDQIATDFKLYVKDKTKELLVLVQQLQDILQTKAEHHNNVIMPGFTHLQVAQPITLQHHLLAYQQMFSRDERRLQDLLDSLSQCPLGSAALAGTSFPIDRHFTAIELGFASPTENSLDTVSDRDFAIEFLFCIAMVSMHLSRLSEEIVLWCSDGFKFIKLSAKFTTGSSIMPQKRNPDAAELIRAKTGRIYGNLQALLVVMKGLPLAYSKDMQEDKEPVFDSVKAIILCLKAMAGMVQDIEAMPENMLEYAKKGYSTATDIADYLVKMHNIPFRKAHHITGQIVKLAETQGKFLWELAIEDMQKIEQKMTEDIYDILSVDNSTKSRTSFGGVGATTKGKE